MPISPVDLAVLGAGPAGLAAAVAASGAGLKVALVDANPRVGGQFWRHRGDDSGHRDRARFLRLRAGLARVDHLAGHAVWHVEPAAGGFVTHTTAGAVAESRAVVLATGAFDRQLPFPGWTLPGVCTAGGAQALLKGHGVLAGKRIVVAGTGPFLLPVAAGLVAGGAEVVGVFEAGSPARFGRHLVAVSRNIGKVGEGVGYVRTLLRHRVPYRTRTTVVAAHGTDEVVGVTVARLDAGWRVVPGSERELACDTVAVGYGFTPQIELALQLGCATHRDADGSLTATVDSQQKTTVDSAFAAGEVCGVGGAALSVTEGELAGLAAAGVSPPARLVRRRAAQRRFAAALHDTFPVRPGWLSWMDGDTVVCRCEEVTAAEIGSAVTELGAIDARAAKLYARPGMGLCQGRVCGFATACLVAKHTGQAVSADDLRGLAGRPIAQPLTLGALAQEDS